MWRPRPTVPRALPGQVSLGGVGAPAGSEEVSWGGGGPEAQWEVLRAPGTLSQHGPLPSLVYLCTQGPEGNFIPSKQKKKKKKILIQKMHKSLTHPGDPLP